MATFKLVHSPSSACTKPIHNAHILMQRLWVTLNLVMPGEAPPSGGCAYNGHLGRHGNKRTRRRWSQQVHSAGKDALSEDKSSMPRLQPLVGGVTQPQGTGRLVLTWHKHGSQGLLRSASRRNSQISQTRAATVKWHNAMYPGQLQNQNTWSDLETSNQFRFMILFYCTYLPVYSSLWCSTTHTCLYVVTSCILPYTS